MQLTAINGMLDYRLCRTPTDFDPGTLLGYFGWPCLMGGSVGILHTDARGNRLNCLIFFTSSLLAMSYPEERSAAFKDVAETCAGWQPRLHRNGVAVNAAPAVDLTLLAACVHAEYPLRRHRPRRAFFKLRGVAIFPVYHGTAQLPARLADFGIATPVGRIVSWRLRVSCPELDPARQDLFVYVVSSFAGC